MRQFTYYVGKDTCGVNLEVAPWYVFLLEDLVFRVCDSIPMWLKLPKIPITVMEDGKPHKTNLQGWYGGVHSLFHIYVCSPVSNWTYKNTKTTQIPFHSDEEKNKLIELIGDDARRFYEEFDDWGS